MICLPLTRREEKESGDTRWILAIGGDKREKKQHEEGQPSWLSHTSVLTSLSDYYSKKGFEETERKIEEKVSG